MSNQGEQVDTQRKRATALAKLLNWIKSAKHQICLWFGQDPGEKSEQAQKNIDNQLEFTLAQKFRGGVAKSAQFSLYASGETGVSDHKISPVFYQMGQVQNLDVEAIFKKEFGHQLSELFVNFELTPIGAASLSQVHRAKTLDGETVAVKIQYPNLSTDLLIDLQSSMGQLLGGIDPFVLSKETQNAFKQGILSELDYIK